MKSLMGFPPCGIFDKVEGVPPTVRNIEDLPVGWPWWSRSVDKKCLFLVSRGIRLWY
jgi:hypothetical protein